MLQAYLAMIIKILKKTNKRFCIAGKCGILA